MIEDYHFGSITIDGKTYNHDVEVRWSFFDSQISDREKEIEVLKWWRKESHLVDVDDVERAVKEDPEIIIIGTGQSGVAKITEKAQDFIKERDIKLIIEKTEEAVKIFNIIFEKLNQKSPLTSSIPFFKKDKSFEQQKINKIIGLFHLTC